MFSIRIHLVMQNFHLDSSAHTSMVAGTKLSSNLFLGHALMLRTALPYIWEHLEWCGEIVMVPHVSKELAFTVLFAEWVSEES